MSAVIIDFVEARIGRVGRCSLRAAHTGFGIGSRSGASPSGCASSGIGSHDFTFWRGASGIRYVHTIYSLLECPELPDANVLLVRKTAAGRSEVMHIGRVENGAACSNLAEVRRMAAMLGANEVHVHLLGATADERGVIERDLSGAGEIAAHAH